MKGSLIHHKMQIADCVVDVEIAGSGPGLLLLHGFPETKLAWKKIMPSLIANFTVVMPDLPGYGNSSGPVPNAGCKNYSKRKMGNIFSQLMKELGFSRYAIAGHDRGGRIAYRMALDHPTEICQLALLNIIPTLEVVNGISYTKAYNLENWFFLSQPAPFPETMLAGNAEFYLNYVLNNWSVKSARIPKESREQYLHHFRRPEVIAGICADYRATKTDAANDQADQDNGNMIICPTLVLWSNNDFPKRSDSPLATWENWAINLTGKGFDCGHFLMEEMPVEVTESLASFFNGTFPVKPGIY
jgi:haloacetate dehalogenase